jgi:hypothetical protein
VPTAVAIRPMVAGSTSARSRTVTE